MTTKKAVISQNNGAGPGFVLFVGSDAAATTFLDACNAGDPVTNGQSFVAGFAANILTKVGLTDEVAPGTWVKSDGVVYTPDV